MVCGLFSSSDFIPERTNHMYRLRPLIIAISITLTACMSTQHKTDTAPAPAMKAQTAAAPANPFFAASTLQYQAPPFAKITDAAFQPAIEEGMQQQIVEIEKIADSADAPTFANTIE